MTSKTLFLSYCRYDCQSSIVDHVFPPLDVVTPSVNQEYSSFAFWRDPIPSIEIVDETKVAAAFEDPSAGAAVAAAIEAVAGVPEAAAAPEDPSVSKKERTPEAPPIPLKK